MVRETAAIIGGAGFLGTRLCQRFDVSGVLYTVFDKEIGTTDAKASYLDVEDMVDMQKLSSAKLIVNLAAMHRDDVRPLSRYDDVNVKGAVNLCDAARSHGIDKIIFTSSVAIYGFAPAETNESGEPNYFNDYGRTKYLAEGVYKEWQAEDAKNRTLIIVRPTVIFGEGNRGNVFNLLKQISLRRFVMFGHGKNKKSMAYVENVAAFLEYSLSFEPGLHIHNYVDKPDLDMNTLISIVRRTLFGENNVGLRLPGFLGISIGYFADVIGKVVNKSLPVSSIRVKKFMGTTQFASSASTTGFIAPVSLEDGLTRTLRYEFIDDNSTNRTFDTE